MNRRALLVVLSLSALVAVSCAKKSENAAPPAASTPAAATPHIQSAMLKRWMTGLANRHPGLNSTHANTLGADVMSVAISGDATSWSETADVDSNGTPETVGFMWDGANKVMYAYTKDPVTLSDGSMADKGLLVCQFGANNTKGKPEGSGWYAYATARDTTGGKVSGTMYGCTFDATGNELQCGTGTFNKDGNEFTIEVTPQ